MTQYTQIKKDPQIWKFCFYGFFKNLKFFEPYLLIYIMAMGINLFQVGLLYALREIITYVFEEPSGIIADHYGKKKELLMCFGFYIVSFIFFFISESFSVVAIGMLFFGLGEAFRSGTHKAMILSYLEHKGWYEHKGFVYGRTRSYSLLGSSLSAFLSILFVYNLPAMRWLFIVCIIPYLIDFLLIASYPSYLDEKKDTERSLRAFYAASVYQLKQIRGNRPLRKILVSSAAYDGSFKVIKDYIQPILSTLLLASGAHALMNMNAEDSLKILLGISYGIFYIFSSFASKNVHLITKRYSSKNIFGLSFNLFAGLLILLGMAVLYDMVLVSVLIFFVLYILKDSRKPVFVDVSSDYMDKSQRATVLSVESQIRALYVVLLAPSLGLLADTFSIGIMFVCAGIFLLILNRFIQLDPS
jgi:MFS family permease